MAGNRVTLFSQTNDTMRVDIGNCLDDSSLANFATANSRLYGLLQPDIRTRMMTRLITYIVIRNMDGVFALLNQEPGLLLETNKEKITNYAGVEYINKTPLQVARVEGDTKLCDLLLTYFFDRLGNDTSEAEKQLEHFPAKLNDEKHSYDFSELANAITQDNQVDLAIEKFRSDLDAIVKTQGFPFQVLLDAGKVYDANFNTWSPDQMQVFSVKVIGYLQRLSPPWLRQVYAEGLRWVVEGGISHDSYQVKFDLDINPALDVSEKGLGYEYCVDVMGVDNQKEIDYNFRAADAATFAELIENIYANKKIALCDLFVDQRFGWEDLMRCL